MIFAGNNDGTTFLFLLMGSPQDSLTSFFTQFLFSDLGFSFLWTRVPQLAALALHSSPKAGIILFWDFSLKISFLSGQLQAMIMRCTEPFVGLGILILVLGWLIGDTSISTSNSHEVFMCPILSNLVKRGETKWCT